MLRRETLVTLLDFQAFWGPCGSPSAVRTRGNRTVKLSRTQMIMYTVSAAVCQPTTCRWLLGVLLARLCHWPFHSVFTGIVQPGQVHRPTTVPVRKLTHESVSGDAPCCRRFACMPLSYLCARPKPLPALCEVRGHACARPLGSCIDVVSCWCRGGGPSLQPTERRCVPYFALRGRQVPVHWLAGGTMYTPTTSTH